MKSAPCLVQITTWIHVSGSKTGIDPLVANYQWQAEMDPEGSAMFANRVVAELDSLAGAAVDTDFIGNVRISGTAGDPGTGGGQLANGDAFLAGPGEGRSPAGGGVRAVQ
jgi:hypothetical protein